jgi:hypothetical protein
VSARLVPHTPRESKLKPILELIRQRVREQTDTPHNTIDRLHNRLGLAHEFLELKASAAAQDATMADEAGGHPAGLFGLVDIVAGAIEDVNALEEALINISNDAYRLLHPEDGDTVDLLFPPDEHDVKGTVQ